jgi:hypothetical protein
VLEGESSADSSIIGYYFDSLAIFMKAVMGYVITLVVCLLGALAAMGLVGLALPREHTASVFAFIKAEPEVIFNAAVDLQEASDIKTTVTKEMRPRLRVTEIIEPPGAAFGGTWTLEIEPTDDGGKITITERGRVYNPLFRFLSRFTFGHDATAKQFLATLRKRVEKK